MNHKILTILPAVILSAGCRSNKESNFVSGNEFAAPQAVMVETPIRGNDTLSALPHAVIYRTNGDYNDNVAVTLNSSRTAIVSYPAPTDVSHSSSPLMMDDGWLLDRRGGIGTNTAFLDLTYDQYSKLPQSPSPDEIMAHIIPNARVTSMEVLPLTATEALSDTTKVNTFIQQLYPRQ